MFVASVTGLLTDSCIDSFFIQLAQARENVLSTMG